MWKNFLTYFHKFQYTKHGCKFSKSKFRRLSTRKSRLEKFCKVVSENLEIIHSSFRCFYCFIGFRAQNLGLKIFECCFRCLSAQNLTEKIFKFSSVFLEVLVLKSRVVFKLFRCSSAENLRVKIFESM